ncbi:MAG TPA: AsmA-like C-terminal region-containing protein [Gemmataceae bacterium]|nr:AsmA-like C-terminal region-containing protein [Gemmataceae bacterium]
MTRPRRYLAVFLAVCIAAGIIWWVARILLSSPEVTAQVASRLQDLVGGAVHLRQAHLGVRGSELHAVQIFEPNASTADEPWLTIDQAHLDIPLWDLIKNGALPSQLTLTGVAITLRFDRAGHLLTQFPPSEHTTAMLPETKIENALITIRQEGHPDFVLHGVHAELREQSKQLTLLGGMIDPTWGEWKITGSMDRTSNASSATLKTADVHFTQAALEELPFVPAKIWEQVKTEGDAAVDAMIRYDPGAERPHWHILLQPRGTEVDVTAISLHADHGKGKLIIDDDRITIADLQGRAAGGEIKAAGTVEFEGKPPQFDFHVDASKLDLDQLPKSWKLPPFGGRLSGHADLQVALVNGKLQTNGTGQGMITGVRIPGAPESKPILLKLHPSGEGFRFSSPDSDLESRRSAPVAPRALFILAVVAAQEPRAQAAWNLSPTELANLVGAGVLRGVDALTRAGSDFLARLPKRRTGPAKPKEVPSYVEAQLGLDDVDIAQLVKGLKISLPFPVAGRISFQIQLAVPLDTPRDLKMYRLRGTVQSHRLRIAGQDVQELRARVVYTNGILRLEELHGQVPPERGPGQPKPGSFNGTAVLGVIPPADLAARLVLRAIPLSSGAAFLPSAANEARGSFSGAIDLRVPATRLKDAAAWEASGSITAPRLELYGLSLEDIEVLLRVHQGTASIRAARGLFEKMPITASAELRLADPYPFSGNLGVQKADLAALEHISGELKVPVSVSGQLSSSAEMKGTLRPLALEASGSGTAAELAIDQFKIGQVSFRWQSNLERFRLMDLQASLYGGTLTGTATLPLEPSVAGTVQVRIQNLDVGAASKDLPNLPIRLEGRATGQLEGSIPAVQAGHLREFSSKLELQALQLRVQGIPTEHLQGSVDYRNKVATYHFEGDTLGGKFHLDGQIPAQKPPPAESAPEGHFRVEGAQLSRLARVLGIGTALRGVGGVFNLNVSFRHNGPHGEPVGAGHFSVDRLRWGLGNLLGSVEGEVVLTEGELRIRNLTGEVAQGMLRGYLAIDLHQVARSRFAVVLDQVEAARLLRPWPALADRVEGPLQIRLRGTLGRSWYGGGEVGLARGRLGGVEVFDWRLPFDWVFAPERGGGQVDLRESTGQLAVGRVVSRATLSWGAGLRVEGHLRFTGVGLRPFLRQMTELGQLGSGQITGRFDFAGNDVHSIDDLTGTLDGRLQQTQALQLPVLQQLTPFLISGQSSAAVFQTGSLRGRLAGGVFRIEQLTFSGTVMQLFVSGTVSLTERLNLEVTANTGNLGVNPTFLRFLGLRIPAVGPVPVALLLEASTYFSNRVAHLRVTGTVRNPVVTVEPLSLLTSEVLRFFVNQANVPLP